MLVSQSTNTKGLVSAVLGNAEIASLGRAPGHRPITKISELADARKWFLDMDYREWGDSDGDGSLVGFGAGYCINWCRNNRVAYIDELVGEWKKVDGRIMKTMEDLLVQHAIYYGSARRRKSKRTIGVPDPNTPSICCNAREIMNKCREKYYGQHCV